MPMMNIRLLIAIVLGALAAQTASRPADVTFTRVHTLAPDEGVFAYARISPDGQRLAYASEMPGRGGLTETTQTVVDLVTKKRVFAEPVASPAEAAARAEATFDNGLGAFAEAMVLPDFQTHRAELRRGIVKSAREVARIIEKTGATVKGLEQVIDDARAALAAGK
jgi:hypothetical protein